METKEIEFEGTTVVIDLTYGSIRKGDIYMARRNTGWKILTARDVIDRARADELGLKYCGWIAPVEPEYPYDIMECFKAVEIR
jgi:hypothetical protein